MRAVTREGTTRSRIGDRRNAAAVAAGQRRGDAAQPAASLQPAHDVLALAGGGDADAHIDRPAERLDLSGEQPFEAEIVADGGERGGIGGQRQGRDRRAVAAIAHGQLRRQMLRVGGAAAIAEEDELAAVVAGLGRRAAAAARRAGERRARVAASTAACSSNSRSKKPSMFIRVQAVTPHPAPS